MGNMFKSRRCTQIAKDMKQYVISMRINTGSEKNYSSETVIYYSKDQDHQSCVAITINAETLKTLIEW